MQRDEILAMAKEAGFVLVNKSHVARIGSVIDWACVYDEELFAFFRLAYAAGQRDMQERAASRVEAWTADKNAADAIRKMRSE